MQHAGGIDIRGVQTDAGAILCNANSHLSPDGTCVAIGKVPGRASGNRRLSKESSETLACLADLQPLNFRRQKTCVRLFGVPIFVAHPSHSPVNIRSLRFPKES